MTDVAVASCVLSMMYVPGAPELAELLVPVRIDGSLDVAANESNVEGFESASSVFCTLLKYALSVTSVEFFVLSDVICVCACCAGSSVTLVSFAMIAL